jgi:WD40 repeat protein
VRLWDLGTGAELQTFREHAGFVLDVAFSGDGRQLASASQDGRVVVRDMARSGAVISDYQFGVEVRAVSFHPTDPTLLAVALNDGTIRLMHLGQPATAELLLDQHERNFDVAFNRDGTRLAIAGRDQMVTIVDLRSRRVERLEGHAGDVRSVAFWPDEDRLVSGGRDAKVMLWHLGRPQRLAHWANPSAPVLTLRYSADGKQVMSVSNAGVVETFDTASGRKVRSVPLDGSHDVDRAVLSEDNSLVAIASKAGVVGVWRTDTGRLIWKFTHGRGSRVSELRFDQKGLVLASAGVDSFVNVWDLATGRLRNDFKLEFAVADMTFDQVMASIIATDLNGSLWMLPLTGGPQPYQLANNRIRSVRIALSADQNSLVVGTAQDRVSINHVNAERGISPLVNIDHMGSIDALVVSARNRIAASDKENNRVSIWDLQSGKAFGVLPVRTPSELAISPIQDGVAVASEGGVIIWDLSIEKLLEEACGVANRNLTEDEWSFYIGHGGYEKTCPDLA